MSCILNLWNKYKQQWTGKTWDDYLTAIQSIDYDKCNHTTGNIATNLLKPAGKANKYVQFG